MRRRSSIVEESEATTAASISRTQSLPDVDESDGKKKWLRRESFTDRLRSRFKKRDDTRDRSQSVGSASAENLARRPSVPDSQKTAKHEEPDSKARSDPQSGGASTSEGAATSTARVNSTSAGTTTSAAPQTRAKRTATRAKIPKRVGFAPTVLAMDPPQQIPPLKPRKGCVEIVNGEVRLPPDRSREFAEYSYLEPVHSTITACAAKKAHENATRLHSSITKGGFLGLFKDEDEDAPAPKLKVEIESQHATRHEPHEASDASDSEDTDNDNDDQDLTPEVLYTRCCHLREILPIKSMLKQLQGQNLPISELHIVNVKPTMIELLAFTDLLRIIPVVWVRMDSLVLEPQMVQILVSSLVTSTHLTKLSFSNTVLDAESWQYLCSFVASGSRLLSLDLSCDRSSSRVQPFDRSGVDWDLLASAMSKCRSIDSLVLSGTMIPQDKWHNLVTRGFSNGRSLVMANNNLSREYLVAIVNWLSQPDCLCLGVDISGNDLSESYDLIKRILYSTKVQRLNASYGKISFNSAFESIFTPDMALNSPLKSLELNGNPELFPHVLDHLVGILPCFVKLRRFEINNCGLNSADVVKLCQALVQCQVLAHISLTGNEELNDTAAAALCVVAHTLKSIVQIDVETRNWPDSFRHQLASYCITNINNVDKSKDHDTCEMLSFEQELQNIRDDLHQASQREVPKHVFDKIVDMRTDCRQKLGNLLKLRRSRPLSVQEQETMFRLFFYDSSIERVITQIKHQAKKPQQQQQHQQAAQSQNSEPQQEDVYALDTPRNSLSRAGSSASLASLKQIEGEEGTFHKINTWLMAKDASNDMESEDNHGRDTLRHLIDEEDTELSDATIQKIKNYTARDLAREINSDQV